ncbi:MAG: trehalose-phosphatase [Rhodomicrobium sp.]|nr:trehalose-phosphatase [Rhodomicrobium sp.]
MVLLPNLRDPGAYGFFFDFDGTLTELAETPEAVIVEDRTRRALESLFQATSGAVAIVTGREIDSIDSFLTPLRLPVAGVHGFERRTNGGATVSAHLAEDSSARSVENVLKSFVAHNPGLLLEKKRGALALHYRLRPELETLCISLVEDLANRLPAVVLTRGKMVIEMRLHRATKGTAINDFLKEPPFRGRVPFFAGDDTTDEDAFTAVNALSGVSLKVGPGDTAARFRVGTVNEFLDWLLVTAETLKGTAVYG